MITKQKTVQNLLFWAWIIDFMGGENDTWSGFANVFFFLLVLNFLLKIGCVMFFELFDIIPMELQLQNLTHTLTNWKSFNGDMTCQVLDTDYRFKISIYQIHWYTLTFNIELPAEKKINAINQHYFFKN